MLMYQQAAHGTLQYIELNLKHKITVSDIGGETQYQGDLLTKNFYFSLNMTTGT